MANVYISTINSNCNYSHDNRGYDDRYEIIGEPKYIYHIEVKKIEKLLIDYLCGMNKFPNYLIITTYNDYEEFETLLKRLCQEYKVNSLADVVLASTEDGGMLKYNVPIFKVQITDVVALESIIRNSFWMAESNCTYILSFSDNVSFKNEMGKNWEGKETEYSKFLIDMSQETMTLGITYDAHGLLLFSNLEEHRSVDIIANQLPNYTILKGN
ncbi:hypothetical protein [Peribacillus acanthi]|uniref:hypothetical protein n=1 Tax=Peribacillus acanthi TaxID=2171554 RepID=UPI000D3ECF58|nr:hypothetical protein [Peribacillus acanthi]